MASWFDSAISVLKWTSSLTACSVAVVGGALYVFQTSLIYPASMPSGSRTSVDNPAQHGMPEYEEIFLETKDAEKLHCYLITQTADVSRQRPTILLLHANAGNMGHRLPIARGKILYRRP